MTCRSGVYYSFNTATGGRKSLHTADRAEATALLAAKTQSEAQSILNLKMAKVYLSGSDPKAVTRTWRDVLNSMIESKTGENKARWERMDRHRPFAILWSKVVIHTTAEDFMRCLTTGSVTTNKFLRVLRNFALDFGWLPHPLIPTRHCRAVKYGKKRAIKVEEHALIIALEHSGWQSTGDTKTDALITLVRELVGKRGHASHEAIDNFLAVGYTKPQVMEVLIAVAMKTISNYLDHINPAPLDAAFASEK